MLFVLTGEIQIGKTRWLRTLVDDLAAKGFLVGGVLAPGQWVESTGPHSDSHGYEKLGIDNLLLPEGEVVPFALRNDIAVQQGVFDETNQAAQEQLGWHIFEDALQKVNDHFKKLREEEYEEEGVVPSGLLVIDELGRLELLRGGGLTEAMSMLEQGPQSSYRHALVIVRNTLVDKLPAGIGEAWGGTCELSPNNAGRQTILEALQASEV